MNRFLERWADAALTTLGFFWMALWAFVLGYLISSCIQVFVTRRRMRQAMGEAGRRWAFSYLNSATIRVRFEQMYREMMTVT